MVQRDEWTAAKLTGLYRPEAFDAEGFIHCSTPAQVIAVANRHYPGQSGLVLLYIDSDKVDAEIVYENLYGGQELFPHIYGALNVDAVTRVEDFEPDPDGQFTSDSAENLYV